MAIVMPENMDFSGQKFSAIIYGSPGMGKTTLALSAPDPILIDFDRGVSRVKAAHRKATIVCNTYEEVLSDLKSPELDNFQTIIIDTGGSFVTMLKDWAMRTKGAVTKSGEFNSLKGFGFVKAEFASFTERIKTVMNKNVIYVFHSQEQNDKDGNPMQRLMCEGATKNTVWNSCDFGGYLQMVKDKRTICFTPADDFFAKSSHGISGYMEVPELTSGTENRFMTDLFNKARANIKIEMDIYAPQREAYDKAMQEGRTMIDAMTDASTANELMIDFKAIEHSLTSKKELNAMWKAKVKTLGLKFDKDSGLYIEDAK